MLLKDIFQSKESVLFLLLWLKKTELLDKGEEYAKKIKDYTIALYKEQKKKKLVLLVKHMKNSTMKKSRKLGKQMYITRHFAIALE